ncbi:cob(I)yrinic acid a,c-diamide adenosyltransferase [Sinorhizobium meliloti]|uniref:cob(I)yrinic acid a,c-diamide adenosyltransferase n=1 Tax=Rhizobium meliloti TaxID=382 RepID=UPI0012967B21|nr:cob(I)yrinic acid a,c-diamide adenosyltransferase [Sinorhizobium meliloti]MDW9378022.1 cob(I)yrinic acid a,c-diamide adenosyltransferase [Sinorhizobium meliloti]MDW9496363.1 cob(I)yrinic acid a,c-diamide adenosyltransferase [Sinorhizobium meliloti]MDW9564876.1 cob(I)yrinic acid a,c-diamide adenosyltransferase [Sinorhizobium meliloti]MDW9652371.1 cob(I)yrinic acid a,c-diamide adenosyltransferase [Sinorhizobium meliloti]MDW9862780.1 cob(I)yrinic acid a,c-diamide adenosyltransferase [Sinorhizo
MVKLNKIYTRTGDNGTTGLVSGPRRLKRDLRVEAYGAIDEANAFVGLARQHTDAIPDLDAMLMRVQNDLFDLGADLATPDTGEKPEYEPLRIVAAQVERLEREIDRLNADLEPLRSFVLPAGSAASAALHVARTVARRAERQMVALASMEGEAVSTEAIAYVNRLSDFLFVAARWANDKGRADVLWVPGNNR